jgi:hypothetical protein
MDGRISISCDYGSCIIESVHEPALRVHFKPPPRPPRAIRSHHRWSWHDRLTCNAGFGPPRLRINIAGVPPFLTVG